MVILKKQPPNREKNILTFNAPRNAKGFEYLNYRRIYFEQSSRIAKTTEQAR
ncbi:hypothetical protein AGMMS49957_04500 [Synergistales bacterium]|nr:hypothetical protein AGMMS49957_04500 [Synergistales bacterium]